MYFYSSTITLVIIYSKFYKLSLLVTHIGYDRAGKVYISIFLDWFQGSFVCGNESDMNRMCASASAM